MPFQPGNPGRPKGALNKRTRLGALLSERVKNRVDGNPPGVRLKAGTTPLEVLMRVMMGDANITERQQKAAERLLPHFHPTYQPVPAPLPDEKHRMVVLVEGGLPDNTAHQPELEQPVNNEPESTQTKPSGLLN